MKRGVLFFASFALLVSFSFVSCTKKAEDTCSSELGDIGPDYGCTVSVMPQICSVNGVDDHYILDGVEYPCADSQCTQIPQALKDAIAAKEGCSTKKAVDLAAVDAKISKQAQAILARLKMEATLCYN